MPRFFLWLLLALPAAAAPQPTTTVLTQVSGTPVYGSVVSFQAAVNAQLGSVTFVVDGQPSRSQVVDDRGFAFLDLSFLPGAHTIGANYSGSNGVYLPSSAATLTVIIVKASTSVQVSATPAQIGQPVTITAYTVLPGAGTANGSVAFTLNGAAIAGCGAAPVQWGVAACVTSFPALGSYLISAQYSGDSNTTAASNTLLIAVGKVVAGVYLANAPDSPTWGSPASVNVLVLGAQNVAAPTGTVSFSSGGRILATPTLDSAGRASVSASYAAGTYAVSAVYNGDANYQPAPPVNLNLVVGKAPTLLTVSSDPAQINQPATLWASVALSAGSGTITGTVDFSIGGNPVTGCSGVPLAGARASCRTSFPQVATYTLGASFSGDANTLPSSTSLPVNVGKAAPGVYLASTPTAPVFGQTISLDGLVLGAPGIPAPTGSISFSESGRALSTQFLGVDGRAFYSTTLPAGNHSLTAVYTGDGRYQSAASAPVSVSVVKAATLTRLTATTGGPFTATVTVTPPGAGTPSGMVQFTSGNTLIGAVSLAAQAGVFTATLASSPVTGEISASYTGDANFLASTSGQATVYATQSVVTLTSERNPSTAGQTVAIAAAVSITPRATAGTPTGAVTLYADGAALETAALAGGQAVFQVTLGPGSHSLLARYSGDASYPASTGSLTQVVSAIAPQLSLTSSAPIAVYGQAVSLTAILGTQGAGGIIQFAEGNTVLGSAPVVADAATLPVHLAPGAHTITASWPGDGTWSAASAQQVQSINKAATTTTLAISGDALLASVAVVAPGAGMPTGSVRFLNAATGAVAATAVLNGGSAAAPLPPTADTLAASYSGDEYFLGAISTSFHLLAVTNAASYVAASVAPDELVTLFAPNLFPPGATVKITDSLGGANPASLLFLSPSQATVLLPAGLAAGPATLTVTAAGRTLSAPLTIAAVDPGIFTADGSGQGAPAAQVIAVLGDGTALDPQPATQAIDLGDPATRVYLILYGTGIRHSPSAVACTIAGQPATVLFAGAQDQAGGLDQVNVLLPAALKGAGAVPLVLTVDGRQSNPVVLTIQ